MSRVVHAWLAAATQFVHRAAIERGYPGPSGGGGVRGVRGFGGRDPGLVRRAESSTRCAAQSVREKRGENVSVLFQRACNRV